MAPIITRASSEESTFQITDDQIPLGEYLFLRICQANPKLRSVFGIPGDFSLALLEHLYTKSVAEKVEFVGFCNELNAAYAADGYAKHIDGLSVLLTTFGVGELSTLNAIAGAFTEYAPILHIVGTTSTKQAEQSRSAGTRDVRNIHHLVQNKNPLCAPNHDVYKPMVESLSVCQESLDMNGDLNLEKIDNVLRMVTNERRPGYIFIPSDVSDIIVSADRLNQPLTFSELTDESALENMASRILAKLYNAKNPSVLGDALADRFGGQTALDNLVEKLPSNFVKLFSTLLARNIDETLPNYIGVYSGKLSSDKIVIDELERNTDFLLTLGHANNEINSGVYSTDLSAITEYVEVHPDYVFIDGEYVLIKNAETGKRLFSIVDLLTKLVSDFDASKMIHNNHAVNNIRARRETKQFSSLDTVSPEVITQNKLVDFFNEYLRPNDILLCDTCSFLFGVFELKFPRGVKFIAQTLYESIGYALPATFGAARAERDLGTNRRVVLIQGDGSAQMTIQEWSTYLRYDISSPEIFLLNNEGYTVERMIKGPTRSYNDIQDTWKWTEFFKIFGDEDCEKHEAEKVNTTNELEALTGRKTSEKIRLYELKLSKLDIVDKFRILRE